MNSFLLIFPAMSFHPYTSWFPLQLCDCLSVPAVWMCFAVLDARVLDPCLCLQWPPLLARASPSFNQTNPYLSLKCQLSCSSKQSPPCPSAKSRLGSSPLAYHRKWEFLYFNPYHTLLELFAHLCRSQADWNDDCFLLLQHLSLHSTGPDVR